MAIVMNAVQRICSTKSELRQLRQEGMVPGVVYGKQLASPASVMVYARDLDSLLRSQPNAVLEIDVPAIGKHSVMVTEVQRDPLNLHLMHVDFHQISMNEEIKTHVRIDATGDAQGVREGGILQFVLHELEVQCLPGAVPDAVTVDISALAIGEGLLVRDLLLPQGVTAKSDPELVVLTILAPQKELSEEEQEEADKELAEAESRSQEARLEEVNKA